MYSALYLKFVILLLLIVCSAKVVEESEVRVRKTVVCAMCLSSSQYFFFANIEFCQFYGMSRVFSILNAAHDSVKNSFT